MPWKDVLVKMDTMDWRILLTVCLVNLCALNALMESNVVYVRILNYNLLSVKMKLEKLQKLLPVMEMLGLNRVDCSVIPVLKNLIIVWPVEMGSLGMVIHLLVTVSKGIMMKEGLRKTVSLALRSVILVHHLKLVYLVNKGWIGN